MQRSSKKTQGRTGDSYLTNATPSLRLGIKQNPDTSIFQFVTSTISNYINPSANTNFDPEADSEYIKQRLKKLAAQITPAQEKHDAIEQQIRDLNKEKQPIPPQLFTERRRLRELIDALQIQQLDYIGENIREHSARRMDLFFLLLIAVYKQNVKVSRARTGRQHGAGTEETLTAGCHHSLFPCLEFEKIPTTIVSSLYQSATSLLFKAENLFPPSPNGEQILQDTHFAEMLNDTAQLPDCVNKFDCHLERHGTDTSSLVDIALSILNRCASGAINPLQGMDQFCDALYASFNSLHLTYIKPDINYNAKGTRGKTPKSFALIWQYEREGALRNMKLYDAGETKHAAASWNYIYLMLGMHKLPASERALSYIYSGPIERRISAMQQEIFSEKYDPENKLLKESLKKGKK